MYVREGCQSDPTFIYYRMIYGLRLWRGGKCKRREKNGVKRRVEKIWVYKNDLALSSFCSALYLTIKEPPVPPLRAPPHFSLSRIKIKPYKNVFVYTKKKNIKKSHLVTSIFDLDHISITLHGGIPIANRVLVVLPEGGAPITSGFKLGVNVSCFLIFSQYPLDCSLFQAMGALFFLIFLFLFSELFFFSSV